MRISILDRMRALCHRDKFAFWFEHFTDEEKELRRMDVWELARIINARDPDDAPPERRIVAEHLLQVRLAKIQSRATYANIAFSLLGIILGVLLTHALN